MARSCGTIIFFILFFLNAIGLPSTLYYAHDYVWGLGTIDDESTLRAVFTYAVCKVDAYYYAVDCNYTGSTVSQGSASSGLFFTCMALDGIMFILGMYEMFSSVEVENKNKKYVHIAAGVIYGIMAIFIVSGLGNECSAVSGYFNHEASKSYSYSYGTGMDYAISALFALGFQSLWYGLLCKWRKKDAQYQQVSQVVAPVGGAYVQPAQPVYVQPGQQVYAQPAYGAPAQPAYGAPAQPAYGAPAAPTQYATPAAPVYAAPTQTPTQAQEGSAVIA